MRENDRGCGKEDVNMNKLAEELNELIWANTPCVGGMLVAHSRRAAGPSDTDLDPSGIEEWNTPNYLGL
jgi:hypothetical protein